MLPQCSHITRKHGVYYYRRRLPFPFAGEVAVSLRTSNYRVAEDAAQTLNRSFQEFFSAPPMSDFDLQTTLRSYLRNHLAALREKHLLTAPRQPVHLTPAPGRDRKTDMAALDHQLRQLRSDLRQRDVRSVEHIIAQLAGNITLSELLRIELGLGILQAHIQLLEQSRQWLTDGLVERIDLSATQPAALSPEAPVPTAVGAGNTRKFSEVLPNFLDWMIKEQGWKGQTLAQNKATYRMLIEWCGEQRLRLDVMRDGKRLLITFLR